MYRRKIEKRLSEWLNSPKHKPLVVKGVRQCGKTSSFKTFAEKYFRNVVFLDFREYAEFLLNDNFYTGTNTDNQGLY